MWKRHQNEIASVSVNTNGIWWWKFDDWKIERLKIWWLKEELEKKEKMKKCRSRVSNEDLINPWKRNLDKVETG